MNNKTIKILHKTIEHYGHSLTCNKRFVNQMEAELKDLQTKEIYKTILSTVIGATIGITLGIII